MSVNLRDLSKAMERMLVTETVEKTGQDVLIKGWVHNRRNMGKVAFLDIRDRSGLVQVVAVPAELDDASAALLGDVRSEYVLAITGEVKARGEKQVNPGMATGTVEILAKKIEVISTAVGLPFELDKDTSNIDEKVRMQYRYLDLRTERLQRNMRVRSEYVRLCREYLHDNGFTEIETPLLTQSTPEGSRDFLVPARLQPGKFFALPQSPQQYKQLLMVAGMERYFQLAKCMRDEDPRADRGFEHTQIDIEMSFVEQEDVMNMVEQMVTYAVEKMGYVVKEKPWPRISYKDAMEKYGDDKFDLRTEEEKTAGNVLAYAWVVDFPFFEKDEKSGNWTFTHNPFSQPLPEYLEDHLAGENTEQILTSQYDMVCNGYESGGGSIRAHDPEVLRATYKTMGYSDEEIEASVGHMLKAFSYGAPPHGGIGMGVERTIMNLTGETYLREVQAFPMTGSGNTAVMDAPSAIDDAALSEYHLDVSKKKT